MTMLPPAPIKIPPGVVRVGTKYESKGSWFDTQIVRWHERTLQAWGGWTPLIKTVGTAVSAAHSDDGGVFTNETTDANDVDVGDVVLVPASPQVNDAFYLGSNFRFTEVRVNVSTAGTSTLTVVWEYWNGTAWVALAGVSDNTNSFKVTGLNNVAFTLPTNWAKNTVNSTGPFYFIRARVTVAAGGNALGTQCFIGTAPVMVDEVVRGMNAWRAETQTPHLIFGTPTKVYVYVGGTLNDVTPGGFTTGAVDASFGAGGFGQGAFGSGPFGVGDLSQSTLVEANTWQFDNFGEDVVGWAFSDKKIYIYDASSAGVMTQLANSPTVNKGGVFVTPERFVVALGADGFARRVRWPDRGNPTVWTPAINNQAGSYDLPSKGGIMFGRAAKTESLIWTDVDLFVMRYINPEVVYKIDKVGSKCGPISRAAGDVVDNVAIWMGRKSFYIYDGFVKPLQSSVTDYVFADMNSVQASKITCAVWSDYGEIVWFYPSGASTEVNRYVVYNYRGNFWYIGALARTSAVDRDAFPTSLAAGLNGVIYQHEAGTITQDLLSGAIVPFAESGPIEIGDGERIMHIQQIIPDGKTTGDVLLSLYVSRYPNEAETLIGPFVARNPTDARASGRWARLRLDQGTAGWRFGTPRMIMNAGGKR